MACAYLNTEERVVEKCTLCEQQHRPGRAARRASRNAAAVRASSATWTRASTAFEAPWVVDVTEGDPSYDKTDAQRASR